MTKRGESGRIVELSQRATPTDKSMQSKAGQKIFKKVLKNLLTKRFDCDIIVERSHEARAELNLDN